MSLRKARDPEGHCGLYARAQIPLNSGSLPQLSPAPHQLGPPPLGFLWDFWPILGGGSFPPPRHSQKKRGFGSSSLPLLDEMRWYMWTGFAACDALITVKWFWGIVTEKELRGARTWDQTRLALVSKSFLSGLVCGLGLEVQFLPSPPRSPGPGPSAIKRELCTLRSRFLHTETFLGLPRYAFLAGWVPGLPTPGTWLLIPCA